MARRVLHSAPVRPELDELIRQARDHVMTPEDLFEQRVSFVYGNVSMANPNVTREMVREIALAELPSKSKLTQMIRGEDDDNTMETKPKPIVQFTFEKGILFGLRIEKNGDANEDDWMEEFGW